MNRRIWTKEEDNYIIENYNRISFSKMADYFNCGITTVKNRAISLGLPVERKTIRRWTEEEIKILKELSETEINTTIAEVLNRSVAEVNKHARKLGIKLLFKKRWTNEQIDYLRDNLNKISFTKLINDLGHDYYEVMRKIEELGLEYNSNRWTEEEELLSDLWGVKPIEYIAKVLNRTETALINRSYVLGLGSQIENNYDGLTIPEISNLFLVGTITILTSWVVLGLKIHIRKISNNKSYKYVTINELFEFLERNQNIWDSRVLEKNILGKEPEWLQEKRKRDKLLPLDKLELDNLNKQQLINSKKYFLSLKKEEKSKQLVKKKEEE